MKFWIGIWNVILYCTCFIYQSFLSLGLWVYKTHSQSCDFHWGRKMAEKKYLKVLIAEISKVTAGKFWSSWTFWYRNSWNGMSYMLKILQKKNVWMTSGGLISGNQPDLFHFSQQTANNLQEDTVKLSVSGKSEYSYICLICDGIWSFKCLCPSARRSTLLNMTSGSLEAFGGEASRAEL